MLMKRQFLLLTAVLFDLGAQAQMSDVTSQYIPNAGFEECESLATQVVHDNLKNVDVNVIPLFSDWSVAKGEDYAAQGWQLVSQEKNANGGIVTYGCNIQSGKYATAGEPGPAQGITGSKGLCFCGAAGLVYQQTEEVTLPAGRYRLTANLYARNGQTTNPGPTQQVTNIRTGFMPTGGTDDNLIPAKRVSAQFASNAWSEDVMEIELTKPTAGRFQVSYGSSYFVVVDDLKLEYEGGVVTTALATVITKAKALNAELASADLSTAISLAEAFMASPTSQEDVASQVETLYMAMSTVLSATTTPVNITAAYLENPSFETGKITPWTWNSGSGSIGEPTNTDSTPFIDGKNIIEFTTSGSNGLTQAISHLPAGYYAIDAKLNKKAFLKVGTSNTLLQGGDDPLYLRVHPAIYHATSAGELIVGANASVAFRIDGFRLFYGKDEASLLARLLQNVKADAQAVLAMPAYADITGEEYTTLQTAINGNDINAINTALNAFVAAKDAYDSFEKAKAAATAYDKEAYPYGSDEILYQIQTLVNTDATSAANAVALKSQLETACFNYYVSNSYCEGVKHTDYTANIIDANATEAASRWAVQNMAIRTDKTGWKNPKSGETDKVVYGVTQDYYRASANTASIMKQTLSGLPAGKYVLSMTMMGSSNLAVHVFFNGSLVGTMTASGLISGGKYGAGWNDYVFEFTKNDATDMPLQLQCKPDANYKEWYIDNFRLYLLSDVTGIDNAPHLNNEITNQVVYDLQGRRIVNAGAHSQLSKGLYIVNGKKRVMK